MNALRLKREIEKLGYKVNIITQDKNGYPKQGIVFNDGNNISPVFYIDLFEGNEEIAAMEIVNYYLAVRKQGDNMTNVISKLTWDYAEDNIMICVQRYTPDADFLTRNYLDLTLYIRLFIDDEHSTKVNKNLIDDWGVTEQEVWNIARKNTERELIVSSIGMMLGIDDDLDDNLMFPLALTNKRKYYGAANIYLTKKIREIAETMNDDLYILPSSIHEILVMPCNGIENVDELKKMVMEVNSNSDIIQPMEILGYNVYQYSLKYDRIAII